MAENQASQPHQLNFSLPTRSLTITGERVGLMFQASVQVSRIEQRMIQASLSSSASVRDGAKRGSDRFHRAITALLAELKEVEKDMEGKRQGTDRNVRNGQRSNADAPAKPVLARNKPTGADNNKQTQNGPNGGQQRRNKPDAQAPASSKGGAEKSGKANAGATGGQASQQPSQPKPANAAQEPSETATAKPAAPVAQAAVSAPVEPAPASAPGSAHVEVAPTVQPVPVTTGEAHNTSQAATAVPEGLRSL
ncbi:hypothetical protein [Pseudomonas sp. P9(2020)]|uniref:hypothetical protein n=1 Tax=Pseudomonas sp. P9(2020) TaxID=2763316 RepID=UPI001B33E09C|nr:hypothetical protein [Pseudomonas sp. P9(2020)]MBP5947997.1 hypothetical protein [Pseudomonas sp. P9(2020)]